MKTNALPAHPLGLACLGFARVRPGARRRAPSPWAGTARPVLGAVVANPPFALAAAAWLAVGASRHRDPAGLLSLPSSG